MRTCLCIFTSIPGHISSFPGGEGLKLLLERLNESLTSVLPITAIVLMLSISLAPLDAGVMVVFVLGSLLLIGGMSLFSMGADMSMQPLGEGIGVKLNKSKKLWVALLCCFLLGVLITVAEPDLTVLAEQIPSVPNMVLILSVAIGVGLFLVIAMLRTHKGLRLNRLLIFFYLLVGIVAIFAPNDFLPLAFDSGGVTTGPITVPFIMALGAGMASIRGDKHAGNDSFGLIALCSVGPILSVLLLSIFYKPEPVSEAALILEAATTKDAFLLFIKAIPHFAKEVSVAFLPMVGVFIVFQIIFRRYSWHQLLRIALGLLYTFVGLVTFLTGANIGFMPAGQLLGASLAEGGTELWLLPVGALIGFFTVTAEPAVHVLKRQVAEVSNGRISQRSIGLGLSIGVSISVMLSMARILFHIPLTGFLIAGYALSLTISFFVPKIYTGIAFDSGGVASGPMTTTFILPFALGACRTLGGNILTDGFGIVAMVAMTPLITIQVIGLVSEIRHKLGHKHLHSHIADDDDVILFYEDDLGGARA